MKPEFNSLKQQLIESKEAGVAECKMYGFFIENPALLQGYVMEMGNRSNGRLHRGGLLSEQGRPLDSEYVNLVDKTAYDEQFKPFSECANLRYIVAHLFSVCNFYFQAM